MGRSAVFSECRLWRYELWRIWDESKPYALFICLNPSTADESNDDPTVRRCIRYAQAWGYGGMCMANIFAFRATDPKVMKAAHDPVGPENDYRLENLHKSASITICAWGTHGEFHGRASKVMALLGGNTYCLKRTNKGHPGHPLYLKKDLKPMVF